MTDPSTTDDGRPVGRRIVLAMLGLGALGVAFGDKLKDI
jgi:hypothetical protein